MPKYKSDLNAIFRNNLWKLRFEAGISYRKLGEEAGMSGVYIFQIEKGLRHPTLETVEKIAKALGQKPEVMLTK